MMKYARLPLILAAPMLLVSCLLTPGQFVSTLDVKRDGGFTFTYAGEVILLDPAASTNSTTTPSDDDADENKDGEDEPAEPAEAKPATPPAPAVETAEKIAERRATAETLAKEDGYRSVEYLGNNKF